MNQTPLNRVIFSADATMFHELGHAHFQDITEITDGVYGGRRPPTVWASKANQAELDALLSNYAE